MLNEAVGKYNLAEALPSSVNAASELKALEAMNSVLGVLDLQIQGQAATSEAEERLIESKIADRTAARKAKDFKRGDQIRDELLAMGIEIKDSAKGTTWTRIVK